MIPLAQPVGTQLAIHQGLTGDEAWEWAEAAIVTATREALREAGRESTPLGLAAVELALALGSVMTPASALAGLARQFEATFATALRGAGATSAPNALRDELAARRAQGA